MGDATNQTRTATASKATRKARPKWWVALKRTLASLWLAFLGYVAAGILQALAQGSTPSLFKPLLPIITYLSRQPRYMQGIATIVFLAVVVLSAWLTWRAWRVRQEQQAEVDQHTTDLYAAGVRQAEQELVLPRLDDIEQAVERIDVHMEQVAQRLEAEAPVAPANVVAPAGLPRPAVLVGRDDEQAAAIAALRAGNTLGVFAFEGMGGIGKSALAAEVVALLSADREAFPGGAAWIPCDGLEGDEGLAELWSRVARALGLAQIAALPDAASRRTALAAALAQTPRVLLALDNVEPGLDAAAAINTLAIANHTALLLTARHALTASRLTALTLKPLREDPAADLFARVLAQRAADRPDGADRAHIPALVAAIAGLPLAIELTAAYAAVQQLPLVTVLAEVQRDGLASAAMTAATTPAERDRIPARRFDHSWDALTPPSDSSSPASPSSKAPASPAPPPLPSPLPASNRPPLPYRLRPPRPAPKHRKPNSPLHPL